MKSTYSTADLAKLLSVNESTVKRWSDLGDLACVKTRGGHRRFEKTAVMNFVRKNGLSANLRAVGEIGNPLLLGQVLFEGPGALAPELTTAMLEGDRQNVLRLLRIAYGARPDLLHLYEELVFPPLKKIGDRWHEGSLSVDSEHLATNTLKEGLAVFQAELPRAGANGLTALCACYESEFHDVALRCLGYLLESEGWKVLFLGQSTPAAEIVGAIRTRKPHLVALSAAVILNERKFVSDVNGKFIPAVRRGKGKFLVGGLGLRKRFGRRIDPGVLCDSLNECAPFARPALYAAPAGRKQR